MPINKKTFNPCIRCGKERIDARSWKKTIKNFMGIGTVTYTETVCPDPECQKIVEKELRAQKRKRQKLEQVTEGRKNRSKNPRDLHLLKT